MSYGRGRSSVLDGESLCTDLKVVLHVGRWGLVGVVFRRSLVGIQCKSSVEVVLTYEVFLEIDRENPFILD